MKDSSRLDGESLAWLHLRRSRHLGDPDDPKLLENHYQLLARLAEADGLDPSAIPVIREVESGEFLSQRPEFLAFLEQLERLPPNAGGVLYCVAMHRLSRGDPQERGRVRVALRRAGILVKTPSATYDLADRTQSLLVGVQSELSEYELQEFKWRVEQSRIARLQRGQVLTGKVPYGYRWSKDEASVVTVPEEFPVLQACCREIRHESLRRLAVRYGVAYWVLHRALRSPLICGYEARRYRQERGPSGVRWSRLLPRSLWVWAEKPGDWPAACSRGEWEEIQQLLASRRARPRWTKGENDWCRDILRFAGAPEGFLQLDSIRKKPEYSWHTHDKGRWRSVPRALVHNAVSEALVERLSCPETLVSLKLRLDSHRKSEAAQNASHASTEALREALAERREELARLIRQTPAALDEEIRTAHYAVQREVQDEIRALSRTLRDREAASDRPDRADLLLPLSEAAVEMRDGWPDVPAALKRDLTNLLLESVTVEVVPGAPGKRREFRITGPVWQAWTGLGIERG